MGQFRPSSLIPSTLTSTYTIDATKDNKFRCKINGTSPTTKYRLVIMKNDTTSTIVYDTSVVQVTPPLFPVNFDGTSNELIVDVPSTSGMQNGNEYKWKIYSYWSDSNFYESYDNIFYTYATATLSIDSFPNTITSKSYTFSATCTQQQGIGVEKFGWILRNVDTNEEIINTIDSGNIYSSELKLFYDGFLNGTNNEIKVKCWLQDGTEVETDFIQFSVSYDVADFSSVVNVKQTCDCGALVTWDNIYYIFGNASGEYQFKDDMQDRIGRQYLYLAAGASVEFNQVTGSELSFSTSCSHIISFYCNSNNSSIYRAEGYDSLGSPYYIELSFENGSFYFDINGDKDLIYTKQANEFWYSFEINNNNIKILVFKGGNDGLYPLTTLYPSLNLYPKDQGTLNSSTITFQANIIGNGFYNLIKCSGEQGVIYTWIRKTQLTQQQSQFIKDPFYIPQWDSDTMLLATYNGNLNAGNTYASSNVVGWIVYRLDEGSSTLKLIKNTIPSRAFLVDYTIKNMTPCQYYVFPSFENEIGSPNISSVFTAKWWDWVLIVCDKESEETYTVNDIYKFDLDVSTGAMTNNTTSSVLENFTKYAKIQKSKSNYWTGTLSSLLGNCANTYSDTVERMEQLKELTTDGKDKFLKDRKGNFWKVALNSAITEQINDIYKEQAVTINIGWMEVGSSKLSKITEPDSVSVEDVEIC